ncbi:hypothetical protein [Enterococcus pallens]|uniref:Uncharacterized protein n=1 Tax=Enterococcus pallens ATCC BAA-351 TaxID=1158607 RepID=R2SAF1_9ENTE|nr:hypothetical protein [Enterococcus pallens]EOH92470.1 hypothetical protein UAU_02922 [Enterococcus pallens ATCC BAA-351]EOU25055.1 hypothetical protein I588_01043 [Enterococcus pallens ATCC BAA-351]OJG76044.1 hypothetical protein RV10_GL004291 [Enterococcus pallens]
MKRRKHYLCLLALGLIFLFFGGTKAEAAERSVVIDRFLTMIYSENKEEAIPIRNAQLKILYYDAQGKRHVLRDDLVSDDNGEVKNVTVNVPDDIIRVYFEYVLSRPEVGKIVNSKGITYRPITGFVIPDNRTIDATLVRFLLNSSVENGREHNYQAIKIWNRYYDMVNETKDSVQIALDAFPQLKPTFNYSFDPIPVLYEHNYKKTSGPAFTSSATSFGEIKKDQPFISIPHIDAMNTYTRIQQDEFFDINLSHEWGHWTMRQAIGRLVGGAYNGHTGFNENEALSYKEGWSVFQANRYTYGYDWNWHLDNSIQRALGKYEFCYGRSTNWTVNSIFRDIYDRESPREPEDQYDLARAWMPNVGSLDPEYRQKLSTGLIFIVMVNSKAKTLAEYIAYMEANDFIKDKPAFEEMLNLNGLDSKGRFTLDAENKAIVYK